MIFSAIRSITVPLSLGWKWNPWNHQKDIFTWRWWPPTRDPPCPGLVATHFERVKTIVSRILEPPLGHTRFQGATNKWSWFTLHLVKWSHHKWYESHNLKWDLALSIHDIETIPCQHVKNMKITNTNRIWVKFTYFPARKDKVLSEGESRRSHIHSELHEFYSYNFFLLRYKFYV